MITFQFGEFLCGAVPPTTSKGINRSSWCGKVPLQSSSSVYNNERTHNSLFRCSLLADVGESERCVCSLPLCIEKSQIIKIYLSSQGCVNDVFESRSGWGQILHLLLSFAPLRVNNPLRSHHPSSSSLFGTINNTCHWTNNELLVFKDALRGLFLLSSK